MTNWLAQHFHVLQFAMRRILATPVASLFNILVIGIALSLPAGVYVLLQNVQGFASQATETPQLSVFLSMNSSKDDAARIGKQLREHEAVDHVEFVPRDQALEQLKHSTGLTDVIGGLKQNPLPDAYVVYPKKNEAAALEALHDEWQKLPGVEKVQLDSAWARKLEALLKFGRMAALILTALLSFALVAVTFNTIRLQILSRREEIEVSRLIGATHAFIRRPLLYFGLLQGLFGGVAAWLIIATSLHLLNGALGELSALYSGNFALHALSAADTLTLLLFSSWLGWLGAWLSVTQHLWQTGAD